MKAYMSLCEPCKVIRVQSVYGLGRVSSFLRKDLLIGRKCRWQTWLLHSPPCGENVPWDLWKWYYVLNGHQMAPLALVPYLTTRWHHLHWLQTWTPDGITWISWKFGHQMSPLVPVLKIRFGPPTADFWSVWSKLFGPPKMFGPSSLVLPKCLWSSYRR